MIVGRTSFIGELEVASVPHIETIVVVEGELILTATGTAPLVLGPQAGVVIGCGTALRIQSGSGVRFSFCAAACDKPRKPGLVRCAPTPTSSRLLRYRPRLCLARPRNAAATTSSPATARITVRAPGIQPHTTGLFARIARTSSCICWPGVYDSPRPMAACCRQAPAMRFSCPRRIDRMGKQRSRGEVFRGPKRPGLTLSEIHHVPWQGR